MKSAVWHPNTQMGEWSTFDRIVSADGIWLTDSKGHKMMDAVASMWCNVWGHSRPELVKALRLQSGVLQHSPMFNLTNDPAEELARSLVAMSPGMYKAFFSDNGSTAMEAACKIALQYWANMGIKKPRIAALENGYHGDTFGAMSVGYVPHFFQGFKDKLFAVKRLPVPHRYRVPRGFSLSDYNNHCLEKIEGTFARDDSFAALVMESGAQVAGGVIIYPEKFQEQVSKICRRHGVLLVLDEVATGFGRLGAMAEYAAQKSRPDIVSFGKMLTGGYLGMAVTLATRRVYDSFLGKFGDQKHLFHGHTYTGNPIAAAVANANLALYKKENLIGKIAESSKVFSQHAPDLESLDMVGDVRYKGMLMGIELVRDRTTKAPISAKMSTNRILYEIGRRNGIYLRTLGNILMLVPPLAIRPGELDLMLVRATKTIQDAKRAFA